MADAKMYYLESDIQKIQVKTNMYIQEYGKAGVSHMSREIIQNAFDECLDNNSPGNKIICTYDRVTDILTVEDNGRGFSEVDYPLDIFCTTLQSGSKFFRENGKSSGEFGVGLSVVNALSDVFEMSSYRDVEGTVHTIKFVNGEKVDDIKKKNTSGKHGTVVKFKGSTKYMGDEAELPVEDVLAWIEKLFYLDTEALSNKNIKCKFDIYNGLSLEESYKFKPQPFHLLLNKIIPESVNKKSLSGLIAFSKDKTFIEDSNTLVTHEDGSSSVEKKPTEKNIHIDVALRYVEGGVESSKPFYDTYCNSTNTTENGIHMDCFDEAFCRFMQSKAIASIPEKQRDKLKVTWDDVRTDLYCVINLSTDAQVRFEGNMKTKISGDDLIPYLKDMFNESIEESYNENKSVYEDIIKIIKLNTKARLEAQKVKTATTVDKLNVFKEHMMRNYVRCNNTGKQWKELILVEGNSAAGAVRNGSDPDTQALFMLRGVTANPFKCSLSEIMNNREWRDLVTVMKCGIGNKFDMSKLYFNRINIFTDSDIDGFNISAGILAFFYKYFRPIIEEGRLYKIYAPLYELKDSKHRYAINKQEMVDIYHENITKNVKVKLPSEDSKMSKDELTEFLLDTYDYADDLKLAAEVSGNVDKVLLELIISSLVKFGVIRTDKDGTVVHEDFNKVFSNQKFITSFMSVLQKRYPELKVNDSGRIYGIDSKNNFTVIQLDDRMVKKVSSLIPIYEKYGLYLDVIDKTSEHHMTISEFEDLCTKYVPAIQRRFKGLGELNGNQLSETALDINHRVSIQYTIEDVERELAIFELMHGQSTNNLNGRKALMKRYKIRKDDLDN